MQTKNKGGLFLTAGKRVCCWFCFSDMSVVLFNQKSKKRFNFCFFQKHIIYTQYTLSFCVLYPRETFFCLLSATLLLVYTRIKRCARCESLSFFLSFLSFTHVARKRLKRIFFNLACGRRILLLRLKQENDARVVMGSDKSLFFIPPRRSRETKHARTHTHR